jgi:hypothetical protein
VGGRVWKPHPGASGAEVGAVSVPVWGLGLGLSVGPGSDGAEAWAPGVRIGVGDLAWTTVGLGEAWRQTWRGAGRQA